MELANGCVEMFAAIVIFILLISMRNKASADLFEKRLTAIVLCHMAVLLLDAARWFLYGRTDMKLLLIILSVAPTVLSLIGNALFVYFTIAFLSQRTSLPIKATVPLISLFIFAISAWASFVFFNGGLHSAANMQTNYYNMNYSWSYWLGHLGWASVCVIGLMILWRYRHKLTNKELLALSSYCILPLIALALRFFWDGAQIFLSTSLSLIWIYAVLQREKQKRLQKQENELVQSRIAILLSQIQPHFLYNALTAICGLCDSDPKEAKKVTEKFSDYLRHNLDSLTHSESISFEYELQHTKAYLEIEQKRFGEKLNILYNIEAEDFYLPALTLQPIAENAVKHGVTKQKNGGTITISTKEHEDYYEIIIADDGIGFDPALIQSDKKIHIGIQNVQERLSTMSNGTLTITSEINIGTIATIKIPKRGKSV